MLSETLSVLLVAYTIEYDNEFEQHMPNRTATFGPGGPASAVFGLVTCRCWEVSRKRARRQRSASWSGTDTSRQDQTRLGGAASSSSRPSGGDGPETGGRRWRLGLRRAGKRGSALRRSAGCANVLAAVAGHQAGDGGPSLALGLQPYPDGWRSRPPYLAQTKAFLADPAGALPRHPMVLHRGGYPDGS